MKQLEPRETYNFFKDTNTNTLVTQKSRATTKVYFEEISKIFPLHGKHYIDGDIDCRFLNVVHKKGLR